MKEEWILKFSIYILLIIANVILLFLGLQNPNFGLTVGILIISLTLFTIGRIKELNSWDLYLSYILCSIAIVFNLFQLT